MNEEQLKEYTIFVGSLSAKQFIYFLEYQSLLQDERIKAEIDLVLRFESILKLGLEALK